MIKGKKVSGPFSPFFSLLLWPPTRTQRAAQTELHTFTSAPTACSSRKSCTNFGPHPVSFSMSTWTACARPTIAALSARVFSTLRCIAFRITNSRTSCSNAHQVWRYRMQCTLPLPNGTPGGNADLPAITLPPTRRGFTAPFRLIFGKEAGSRTTERSSRDPPSSARKDSPRIDSPVGWCQAYSR